MRKILAISMSLPLVSFIPVRVLIYSIGNTTMAGMNMARSSASNHRRVSMTNEATGTDLSTLIGRPKKISIKGLNDAIMANKMPKPHPRKKPRQICEIDANTLHQNSLLGSKSCTSTVITLTGVGRNISLSIVIAANCHIHSHISADAQYIKGLMKLFLRTLFFNIEHSFLKLAAYGLRVLVIEYLKISECFGLHFCARYKSYITVRYSFFSYSCLKNIKFF